ncbi:cobaltochelatase subunit CobN [Methanolobus sp. ZRKC3]|uniref:cobaltochelatase subunit CobN n=1 Tax=Methanolobus sp. ZRKC3 TaxID=3125786 RepID=UPI003245E856
MIENRSVGRNYFKVTGKLCLILFLSIVMFSASATAMDLSQFEFVANTTCDVNGQYAFTDLYDGNYTVVATDIASDGVKWYAGHLNETLNGLDLTEQNIKINSTNEVELNHDKILGFLERSSISGMTYVMNPTHPKESTVVMVEQGTAELVADTTCDAAGNYSFNNIPNGDYTIFAVYDASTANETKWYRGMLNITVNGTDLDEQNLKINSSNNIDHNVVLKLLNRSAISGMTYVMNADHPKESTVVMVEQGTGELVGDTICDVAGNYSFYDIHDGDYSILAVYDASTANETKWYRGMLNITVNGADLTEQNMKINSSNNIDHTAVLGMLNRSSISGMTYVMKTIYPKQSTVVLLKPTSGKLTFETPYTNPETPPANETETEEPSITEPEDEYNYESVFKYFNNITSDEFGDYQFSDVPNGDYLIKAVQYSTAMEGMWLTNVQNITIQNGQPIEELNLSMRKNDEIDHHEILGLLDRTTIAGKTISKKGANKTYVDVMLTTPYSEFIVNTTSDEFGDYQFSNVQNGDYLIKAVQYSTAMEGMWLTNVQNITVENGQPIEELNLSMRKNDDIDHMEILGLLDRTTISGKTISKKGANKTYVDVMLTTPYSEFIVNTTSDEFGDYQFSNVQNGDYLIKAVQYSTAMEGMWLTNVQGITVENGQPIEELNLSIRKNDEIDHQAILGLLDRTTIAGKTISKKGANKTYVDMVLLKRSYAAAAKPSNAPHLNVSIVTGYASHEVQLAHFTERVNNDPDLNMTASYYLADKLQDDVDLSQMDIIYVNMFTTTAHKLQETVQDAIDNGALVIGYNTQLPESEYDIPVRFNNDSSALKSHLQEYWLNGASNSENFDNLMFYLASEYYDREDLTVEEPIGPPGSAIYHPAMTDTSVKFFTDNATEYFQWYSSRTNGHTFDENAPTVGISFYKSYYPLDMEPLDVLIQGFEERGVNVVACYGASTDHIDMYLNNSENTKVDAVISFNYRGNYFDVSGLGVPVINGVLNGYMNTSQWLKVSNPIPVNRMLRLYGPEKYGLIDPIMIGAEETDLINGGEKYVAHQDQVDWLIERTLAQANLGLKAESEKKVAIIYYNHGGGKDNIGASYLEVAPSIVNLLEGMDAAGYEVDEFSIPNKTELTELMVHQGRNVGTWAPGELDKMVATGKVELIPESTYISWFNTLPEQRRTEVIDMWGEAPGKVMVYTDGDGNKFMVIPKISLSDNVILAPQPTRGWLQDNEILYHDEELPPHHQYIAFYLWMQNEFDADAMVNMGRHGTVEWLPGKDFCLLSEEWPAIMTGDIPVVYPYVMDGMGEGMQAKRRGNAVIIDHLIPPVISAGSYGNYSVLNNKINVYKTSVTESESILEGHLQDIIALTLDLGLDSRVDMSLAEDNATVDIFLDDLDDVLRDLRSQSMPYGLHILGQAPKDDKLVGMVNSMLGDDYTDAVAVYNGSESAPIDMLTLVLLDNRNITDAQMQVLGNTSIPVENYLNNAINYAELLAESNNEIEQVLKAMDGEYIEPNLGGDPILRPDTLPSGRNFYSFDEQLIPTVQSWEQGTALVDQWIEDYHEKYGEYPNKAGYILWAGESTRHEGVMESQILYLLGTRPVWDEDNSKVVDVELIPTEELGRPRIDVLVQISGLYRDTFPMKIDLIDKAVRIAYEQDEPDNYVRENTDALQLTLNNTIGDYNLSLDIAQFRIFGPEDGSYGTGMANAVSSSNTWEDNSELAELYINKMSYIYGENIRGQTVEKYIMLQTGQSIPIDDTLVFKSILDGTKVLVHSRSSNTYGATNTDEFFQYMSGLANTIKVVSGEEPELLIANLENPADLKIEDVQTYLLNELYTVFSDANIEGWMAHGYEGARMMLNFVENLWGLEALTPGLVTDDMWDMTYETFVNDPTVSEWMKEVSPYAYESTTGRLIEVIRTGNWDPSNTVRSALINEYLDAVNENGVTCCHHTCGNPLIDEFIQSDIDSGRSQVSQTKMDTYKKIMEETRNPLPKSPTPSSKKSSSNTGTELNVVETTGRNQTSYTDSGSGEIMEEEASLKSPTEDNYVEGYEMTRETVVDESESSSYSISGSDIMASFFVIALVGAIYVGFWRRKQF